MAEARANSQVRTGAQGRGAEPNILRWRGVAAGASRSARMMLLAVIAVGAIGLSFSQLGLVGIGAPGEYLCYAVTLIAPVALAALLLGMVQGAFIGLVAGGALFVHSSVQPLDFYEIVFVTPLSSIAFLAVLGTVFGALFYLVLRRGATGWRRVVGIAVVCVVGVALFGWAFSTHGTYVLSGYFAEGVGTMSPEQWFASMGNVWVQTAVEAVATVIVCLVVDAIARRAIAAANAMSFRTTFRAWLLGVVVIAFVITGAVSFAIITEQEKASAYDTMGDEANYLCMQLEEARVRTDALDSYLEKADIDPEADLEIAVSIGVVKAVLSADTLLDGYSLEYDGIVMIIQDGIVIMSDDPEAPNGTPVGEVFDESVTSWFDEAASTGVMEQLITIPEPDADEQESAMASSAGQTTFMRVAQTLDYTAVVAMPSTMVFEGRAGTMMWITLMSVVLLAAVFLLASYLLTRIVVRRIDETNGVLARITEGDLTARVHVRDSREFASLSDGINATVGALEGQIAEVQERAARELSAAKEIQSAALPRIFPPYPDIMRFDIYAIIQPAREVGGDFYDFFLVGDDSNETSGKLGFVIADVSGKSVSAALFMMAAKSQIRNYMESGMELGEAFENANRKICEGNDAGMFVTAFAGIYDYGTGHLTYVNAGHNPPLLWRDGAWNVVSDKSGLPLGLFDGLPYVAHECDVTIGDELLLYTDGVTEAMDVNDQIYTLERLEHVVRDAYYLHPRELIDLVRRDVESFAEGADQADDITMLAVEFGVPPEISSTLVVPAVDDELPHVTEFVHTELDRRLCPLRAQKQLDIAIEELFVNVAHYAYPDAAPDSPGTVRISYTYRAEPPLIIVEIADSGIPFDPLAKPDAVTPDNIMDVKIGGLGILMAKKSVDEMTYERVDDQNVVTITKKW